MKFKDYLTSINVKNYEELEVSKQAELYNDFNDIKRKEIAEAMEQKASKEDILALKTEFSNSLVEQQKAISKHLEAMGVAIKNVLPAKAEKKADLESLLIEKKADLLKLKNGELSGKLKMSIKASATMTTGNITGGDYVQAQRLPLFNDLPLTPINNILAYVNSRSASSPIIEWVDKRNRDGQAGYTVEALAKNQVDFDFVVENTKVQKITAYTKVSTEMLGDVSFVRGAINDELRTVVTDKLAIEVLNGAGGANAIQGILGKATAYDAGAFADGVDSPNTYDVLRTALTQISNAGYNANTIMLNPADYGLMQMTKSADAVYVNGVFMLQGVRIVQNAGLTADAFLVYDSNAIDLYKWENFNIEMGHDADDLTKNLVTFVGELRACTVISTNKAKAIVTGSLVTAKGLLDSAV